MFSYSNSFYQKGVSFLEIIVVVAIIGITSFFVMPNISAWKIKAMIDGDFNATLSQIEYIKSRVAGLSGTGLLICNSANNLYYQISKNRQADISIVSPFFAASILEDTSSAKALSGKTNLISDLCSGKRGIFISNGFSGLESGGLISIEMNYMNNKIDYPAYKITVTQSTSFVQKYMWNQKLNTWAELE